MSDISKTLASSIIDVRSRGLRHGIIDIPTTIGRSRVMADAAAILASDLKLLVIVANNRIADLIAEQISKANPDLLVSQHLLIPGDVTVVPYSSVSFKSKSPAPSEFDVVFLGERFPGYDNVVKRTLDAIQLNLNQNLLVIEEMTSTDRNVITPEFVITFSTEDFETKLIAQSNPSNIN